MSHSTVAPSAGGGVIDKEFIYQQQDFYGASGPDYMQGGMEAFIGIYGKVLTVTFRMVIYSGSKQLPYLLNVLTFDSDLLPHGPVNTKLIADEYNTDNFLVMIPSYTAGYTECYAQMSDNYAATPAPTNLHYWNTLSWILE